ncbi:MAG: PhnD/SsuA/transferrin family substrate-binding protein, partial [Schleiferilactobacillus harbinensis]
YLMVPKDKAAGYQDSGTYSLKTIKGKRISYVSNTSTSGFAIPAGAIQKEFKLKSTDALAQSGQFFQKVLYGGSHQGSAVNLFKGDADVAAFDDMDLLSYGKFTNDSAAGATFTVNTDAPAPFDAVRGKESVAIAAYQVQNEPLAVNKSGISASDIKKITTALTSSRVANDPLFFAPAEAKTHSLLPKDGDTKFIKISDDWYKPTHDILGE